MPQIGIMPINENSDVVFFFGYVQLSPEERKYSAANFDSSEKLAAINGARPEAIHHLYLSLMIKPLLVDL